MGKGEGGDYVHSSSQITLFLDIMCLWRYMHRWCSLWMKDIAKHSTFPLGLHLTVHVVNR